MKEVVPKRLVIEWRYQPTLSFYPKMDHVGSTLTSDFPDWQRTPLTLELRNRNDHKRLHLSSEKMFLELNKVDQPESAIRALSVAAEGFEIKQVKRLGMRFFYALTFDHDFDVIKETLTKRLFQRSTAIDQFLGAPVSDLGYVIDLAANSAGWESHLRAGPMRRKQWLEIMSYEREIFPPKTDRGEDPFERFKATIPETMLYFDLDLYRPDVASDSVGDKMREALEIAQDKAKALVRLYVGK